MAWAKYQSPERESSLPVRAWLLASLVSRRLKSITHHPTLGKPKWRASPPWTSQTSRSAAATSTDRSHTAANSASEESADQRRGIQNCPSTNPIQSGDAVPHCKISFATPFDRHTKRATQIWWLVSIVFNSGRSLTVAVRFAYRTAPSILAFLPPSRSSVRVTQTCVVSIRAAIEAAFDNALITTFAGSMMPALNMSTYSPVLAL